ncbi:MAG TPA: hypothetical protein VI136_14825 [Verrucomicrobiae bacterium]
MNSLPVLLALIPDRGPEPQSNLSQQTMRDVFIIVAVVLGLTALLLAWALVIRKPRRRHGSHHKPEDPATLVRYRQAQNEDQGLLSLLKPKHRRRKRRFHHRNPTLAETGGLPPPRSEQSPAPRPPTPL